MCIGYKPFTTILLILVSEYNDAAFKRSGFDQFKIEALAYFFEYRQAIAYCNGIEIQIILVYQPVLDQAGNKTRTAIYDDITTFLCF